ncbi:ATP-binding protein [Sulfuracidifex tepidarius]|uniref:DNA double-strand break repair helicase HerA n=1 Tax=Sulfuracidifex tepidarius TaxID=1294262 RepID=A0A510DVV8_9CREN|nr:ATP-binding protein [Sulfuracidifex tepidarius]BBG24363.1 DNA double-strand break repair helicase HerA [Sulfuracidifex tepidarius]BBG27121.1 DNA double-strand break repair helicase HerA [Sulfuracidifex tepidarius]
MEITGKLREVRIISRPTADGRGSVSFRSYVIEFPFSRSKFNIGRLLYVPTIEKDKYLLLEIADFQPFHYGMINLDPTIPLGIRNEIMKGVEESWNTEDSTEAWIDVYAYPIGYVMSSSGFTKGYLPPLPGSEVRILGDDSYRKFVCHEGGPSIGKIYGEEMELNVDLRRAIRYHIGVFAFTGSGKSNLSSLLVRKILSNCPDTKVVVFDVSMEYSVLLNDLISMYNSRVITTDRVPKSEQEFKRRFLRSHVWPEEILDLKAKMLENVGKSFNEGKVKQLYVPPQGHIQMAYGDLVEQVRAQAEDKYTAVSLKPIFYSMLAYLDKFMRENKLTREDLVDDRISSLLDDVEKLAKDSHARDNASIFTFISSLRSYISTEVTESDDYDVEKASIEILDNSQGSPRLFVFELPNLDEGRQIVSSLVENIYSRRKRSYSTDPKVLFVIDEAQEFIPYDTRAKGNSETSSATIEKLLRHGRKYYLNALISTQRLAYLNTNVLQQLHTYFISTLPRPYDRQLVAETFGINDSLLDRTLDLESGQWLLVSFKAALPHDVPVFFEAENNLDLLKKNLV